MPLTDTAIRNAKPSDKARKMFDSRGLYLEVSPRLDPVLDHCTVRRKNRLNQSRGILQRVGNEW